MDVQVRKSPRVAIEVDVLQGPDPGAYSNSPVCGAGSSIQLNSDDNGFYQDYSWTGPKWFHSSTDQNPVISNATSANAGNYTTTLDDGTCSSSLHRQSLFRWVFRQLHQFLKQPVVAMSGMEVHIQLQATRRIKLLMQQDVTVQQHCI